MTAIASHRSIAAARVKEALDSKRVTLICVGPPTATAFFESCGIPSGADGCIRSWDGYDAKDLDKITGQVSEGLKSYAAAREAGETPFGHVFSGPNVREVLGLPADCEVTVEPGDMGNLKLFLESSSHNRLLVRGTDLIVRLDVQPQAHTWVKPQPQSN